MSTIVNTINQVAMCITCAREDNGNWELVSPLIYGRRLCSFSASWPLLRLKYRIRINLLIVVKKTVLRWYTGDMEDKDIRFHNSSHLSKQVNNSTGWAGKVFIWYGRCL